MKIRHIEAVVRYLVHVTLEDIADCIRMANADLVVRNTDKVT
jgi:hypothetical protein